jgi:hypothetical protein
MEKDPKAVEDAVDMQLRDISNERLMLLLPVFKSLKKRATNIEQRFWYKAAIAYAEKRLSIDPTDLTRMKMR